MAEELPESANPPPEDFAATPTPADGSALKPPADAPQASGRRRLRYLPAFRYVFEHPQWLPTLLLASVCSFLPVLGPLALLGYYYELVECLFRYPGQLYPQFEFRRFSQYCTRGVWPYVLGLMIQTFLQIFIQLPLQAVFQVGIGLLVRDSRMGTIVLSIAVPLVLIFVSCLVLAVIVLMTPFLLRAGLTQEFSLIFKFPWVKDYLRKMWLDITLATLLVMVTAPILYVMGCAVMCVGIVPATVLLWMFSANLSSQLYVMYLERGGEPIPLRPLPAEVPPLSGPPASEASSASA